MTDPGVVRPLVFLPADIASDKIGGILTFVKGFVKFAPADFAIEIVGTTSDPAARPVGRWLDLDVEGRTVRYLPIVRTSEGHRRARVPVALRYTVALAARRRLYQVRGRVLQFHRIGAPLVHSRAQAPRIQVVHLNVRDIGSPASESRWRLAPALYSRLEDLTVSDMTHIFVVNRQGVDFYRRRHPELAERISFLPTWFDDTMFQPPSPEARSVARAELLAELRLPPTTDARVVLFVGRLESQKDPTLLVEGFAAAAREDPSLHLAIIGDGGLRESVQRRASQVAIGERIHLLGFQRRPRIAVFLAGADAMLLTSAFEGMPISVLEALGSGLPVVATPVGEIPLVVLNDTSGRLIEARDPRSVAEALLQVVHGPVRALRAGAVEAAAPYRPAQVLGPFYDAHRHLAA